MMKKILICACAISLAYAALPTANTKTDHEAPKMQNVKNSEVTPTSAPTKLAKAAARVIASKKSAFKPNPRLKKQQWTPPVIVPRC